MKIRIPRAVAGQQKFTGSPDVFSTNSVMEYCPVYYFNVIPNSHLKVNLKGFGRTIPMPVPTMGRLNVHYNAFFVPYSSIFRGWHDFITDTLHVMGNYTSGVNSRVPYFSEQTFIDVITQFGQESTGNIPYDIDWMVGSTHKYFRLSKNGRRMYKIFTSLGYRLSGLYADGYEYNALHLLAALRIYMDYYFPTQFRNDASFVSCQQILNADMNVNMSITAAQLLDILTVMNHACYLDDYFTSSFVKFGVPNTPYNPVTVVDITNGNNASNMRRVAVGDFTTQFDEATGSKNTPIGYSGTSGSGSSLNSALNSVSQNMLNLLQRMTMFYKRNSLAGSFAYERMLARFGLTIHNDCSKFIDSYVLPLNVGDVMSNTDNYDPNLDTGASLGSYAGKGMYFDVSKGGYFEFKAPDYGIFMIISSVIPDVGYYQGIDVHCLKTNFTDFFQPEYDGLGMQAIRKDELYIFKDIEENGGGANTFGFTPRYSEYKFFRDNVSGDFLCGSINAGLDAYHSLRQFDDVFFDSSYAGVSQSLGFIQGADYEQYNRIFGFQPKQDMGDPIRLHTALNIEMYAPMRSQFDDIDFDQLEHNHSGSGEFNLSGAKIN